MKLENYFDHAATTPLDPRVFEAMRPWFTEMPGNAHSIHQLGLAARAAVEQAREQVAELIGADDPAQIVFTSGATEANNWVLGAFDRIAVSPFEHSSVREPAQASGAEFLVNEGYALQSPKSESELVSVMSVNNETGAILDLPSLGPETWVHRDITQEVGKREVSLDQIEFASFSAHKFYGPKGVGALYLRGNYPIEPLLRGGGQESGQRAGTLNVPGIVGMGAAAVLAQERHQEELEKAQILRKATIESLSKVPDCQILEAESNLPQILGVIFLGVQGESLVIEADHAGFAISSGAACSSQSTEPSPVLVALGIDPSWLRGAIRISFGPSNTLDSAEKLGRTIQRAVETLRGLR